MNSYLKGFTDPEGYKVESEVNNCKCNFIGIIEPRARERTWVYAFFEKKCPSNNELVEMFKSTFGLTGSQSVRFLEHDLSMGDFTCETF